MCLRHSIALKRILVHVGHEASAAPFPCLQDLDALDELQGKSPRQPAALRPILSALEHQYKYNRSLMDLERRVILTIIHIPTAGGDCQTLGGHAGGECEWKP